MDSSHAGMTWEGTELEGDAPFDAISAGGDLKSGLVGPAELGAGGKPAGHRYVDDWKLGLSDETAGPVQPDIEIISHWRN